MILLVGKSASGKDTIQKELIKLGMKSVVSYTTRPARVGEVDGITYHFISKEEFIDKYNNNFFVETTSYNIAGDDIWYYGSAIKDLSDDRVMIINPEGLRNLKEFKQLNLVAFYIMANSEILWQRLLKRGDNLGEASRRLDADNNDFSNINDDIDFAFRNDAGLNPTLLAEMILYTYDKTIGGMRY